MIFYWTTLPRITPYQKLLRAPLTLLQYLKAPTLSSYFNYISHVPKWNRLYFNCLPSKNYLIYVQDCFTLAQLGFSPLKSTLLMSFISPHMLTLLQLQTIVIFTGHPKIGSVFTNHIAWWKRWFFGLFPSAHSQMAPLLNISLSKTLTYRSWDPWSNFDLVLHSNLNTVCFPNFKSFPEQFLASFCAFYDQAYNFSWIFMDHTWCGVCA